LTAALAGEGHEILRLVRRPAASSAEVSWNPEKGRVEREKLEGVDALVHLAGESIASRWTRRRKAAIVDSRVSGTRLIAESLASLAARPRAFVSASAIGYYGPRDRTPVDETAARGSGFLAETAERWEAATEAASAAGIRTVRARFGVILAREGGALAKMLPPFRLGLGGPVGSGRQGVSWIALVDVVRALGQAIADGGLSGPVNVVAPEPVPQREFAAALGRALGRPAVVPFPAFAVRTAFGTMGEEVLLGGAFVVPAVLQRSGFVWQAPRLEEGLALALRRTR
jgi:uncharacterized protein (TIGR01777 family)